MSVSSRCTVEHALCAVPRSPLRAGAWLPASADDGGNWTGEEEAAAFDEATEHDDVFLTASSSSVSVPCSSSSTSMSCASPASPVAASEECMERLSALLLDALATSFSAASLTLGLGLSMVWEQCGKVGECTPEHRFITEAVLEASRREKEDSGDSLGDVLHAHEGLARRDAEGFTT